MAFLPVMVMEHEKLIEKHAKELNVEGLKPSFTVFTGPSAQIDALLSGTIDIISTGSTGLITLWARTKGSSLEVKGLSALSSMPMALNSRNPRVQSIQDFTESDRIAVPSIKVSFNATLLQMAAAKLWGDEDYGRLDHLTVGLGEMDALATMLTPHREIDNDFTTPPFIYIEQADKNIHPVITMKQILGENGTIATCSTTTRFYNAHPQLIVVYLAALKEAMDIIAADRSRAVDDYVAATGDKTTSRELLMRAVNDPDADFTTVPHSMMRYAKFMFLTGTIKRTPDSISDLFFQQAVGGS